MALAQTELPELKRFTFFVSRRFEEGRERFRLHMGYFATLAEAEEWLGVVREIYPGAWAGEAPGRKLRERAVAAAVVQAQHTAGPHLAPAPVRAAPPRPPEPMNIPVVHAAPPAPRPAAPAPKPAMATPARPVARPAPAPAARPAPATRPAPAARPTPAARPAAVTPPGRAMLQAKSPPTPKPAAVKAPPAPVAQRAPVPAPAQQAARSPAAASAAAAAAAAQALRATGAKPVFEDSNVREVLKALGDTSATGETRLMRAPPAPRAAAPAPDPSLSDTQVLKMLETRRPEGVETAPEAVAEVSHGSIPLLKPDDTGTRRALKEAVTSNAPVAFAVQLQWSVQPPELDQVPPLAIFSAYTLYTVEGSREGRKWYGLRLGFFSDAISAKQVAYYVRSEFTSVAVVPVSPQEKAHATDQDMKAAMLAAPAAPRRDEDEFKLIDDAPSSAPAVPAAPAPAKPGARPQPKVAVGRMVRQPPGGPRRAPGKIPARA
ncbi:MAG TPA: hypothetical protein VFO23_08820, partial [Steroidobacteraceae bacterium]|nr:hypothetical protein [Steroidobacteraceae bacterium]